MTARDGTTLSSAAAVRVAGAVTLRFRDDSVDAVVGDEAPAPAPAPVSPKVERLKVERKAARAYVAPTPDQPTLL